MKYSGVLCVLVFSSNLLAADLVEYVACQDIGSQEYNFVLEVVNKKAASYSTVESDFKYYESIVADGEETLFFQYASEYDTNLGYVVDLNADLTETVGLAAWTSGNDSDNYYPVIVDVPTACHLLKSKPSNTVLVGRNVARILHVQKLTTVVK